MTKAKQLAEKIVRELHMNPIHLPTLTTLCERGDPDAIDAFTIKLWLEQLSAIRGEG